MFPNTFNSLKIYPRQDQKWYIVVTFITKNKSEKEQS